MSDQETFRELMRQVRAGDEQAAVELVRIFEPEIRRAVRVRLVDADLRRIVDSTDICQSVLGSFFVRAALGQYDLDTPEKLLRLFISMARNKVADWARREGAQRRDFRRRQPLPNRGGNFPDSRPSPSAAAAARELLEAIQSRLSDEERLIARRRADGVGWFDVAREMNSTAEALRKRLTRAIDRVAGEMGLEDPDKNGIASA